MKYEELKTLRSMSLDDKIMHTVARLGEFYDYYDGMVSIGFSGGIDSTVLVDIAHRTYPDIPLVFSNTGLEYPEIVKFVESFEDIVIVKPKMKFPQVIDQYGYPVVSKRLSYAINKCRHPTPNNQKTMTLHLTGYNSKGVFCPTFKIPEKWKFLLDAPFKISDKCCHYLKKQPLLGWNKKEGRMPITGEMASDSRFRENMYLQTGCNAFDLKQPKSTPMGFWTRQDVLRYIERFEISYCKIYGNITNCEGVYDTDGVKRTGCIFCMFGVHLEKSPNRFEMLKTTHPNQWKFCIKTLKMGEVMDFMKIPYGEDIDV